jgi:hypothetical protein
MNVLSVSFVGERDRFFPLSLSLLPREGSGGESTVEHARSVTTSVSCLFHLKSPIVEKHVFILIFVTFFWVGNCFVFSPNLIMDLEAPARSIQRQHLLAKSLLALFSRNIALLDIANSRRGRAFVQVLHKLAQRVLVALCFAGDLEIMSMDCDCSTV